MNPVDTSELSSFLYQARSFLGAILPHCHRCRALAVGVSVMEAQRNINDAICALEGTADMAAVRDIGILEANTNNESVRP